MHHFHEHVGSHHHEENFWVSHFVLHYMLLSVLTLLSIGMGVLICYMSTSTSTDILNMSKLLLLVERGFFEVYKKKYETIIHKFDKER